MCVYSGCGWSCPSVTLALVRSCWLALWFAVGWLFTVEAYYKYRVKSIYTTVLEALIANPARKFISVEMAFFNLWWNEASLEQQSIMRTVRTHCNYLTLSTRAHSMFYLFVAVVRRLLSSRAPLAARSLVQLGFNFLSWPAIAACRQRPVRVHCRRLDNGGRGQKKSACHT